MLNSILDKVPVYIYIVLFVSTKGLAESYQSLQPLIDRSCTPCHAVSQSFQIIDFPFLSNKYPSQVAIVSTMIERASRDRSAAGAMPPLGSAYPALLSPEVDRLIDWLKNGLPGE